MQSVELSWLKQEIVAADSVCATRRSLSEDKGDTIAINGYVVDNEKDIGLKTRVHPFEGPSFNRNRKESCHNTREMV